MAINRNLQFYGTAYGDTPVTLDVKINGQQVFLNTVSTLPGVAASTGALDECDQVLFEVNDTDLFPITFHGSYDHSIEVSGGSGIIIGKVLSNYMSNYKNMIGSDANLWNVYGNSVSFLPAYALGTPVNSEGTPDIRSSVEINGVTQVPPLPVCTGLRNWTVNAGSNLSCKLNISLGSWSEYHPDLNHGHEDGH
jgi:hypothetical protein